MTPRRDTGWQRAYEPRARRVVADLSRFARADEADRRRRALDRRLARLARSLWASPGWRDRLCAGGFSPRDLRSLEDLAAFPVLERHELDGGLVTAVEDLVVARSSGSTGQPVSVYRDPWDSLHMWAVLRFFCERSGIDPGPRPRVVLLCSLPHGQTYSRRIPLFRDGALHRIAIAHGDAAERIARVRPAVLFTDPAGLQWLAARPDVPRPRLLLSSAQHLWPELRSEFHVPLVNYYSTTETGPIAWECERAGGRFHVLLPDVWVEAHEGRLLVTRLRRSALPLIRYATGDGGRVVGDACACGYRGLSILDLSGRGRADFVRPDGSAADAWQLAWIFKQSPLSAFRLTQEGRRSFLLETSERSGLVPSLRTALAGLGWSGPLEIRERPGPLPAASKPQPFVCRLTRSRPATADGPTPSVV